MLKLYFNVLLRYLLPNRAVLVGSWLCFDWSCFQDWVSNGQPNYTFLRTHFGASLFYIVLNLLKFIFSKEVTTFLYILPIGSMQVPVVNCSTQVAYGEAARRTMLLADYLDHLESISSAGLFGTSSSSSTPAHVDCLYLKDWHLCRDNPRAQFYSCPPPFRDDLLNLYFDRRPQPPPGADADGGAFVPVRDDYRFVYIGPAHSWCARARALRDAFSTFRLLLRFFFSLTYVSPLPLSLAFPGL